MNETKTRIRAARITLAGLLLAAIAVVACGEQSASGPDSINDPGAGIPENLNFDREAYNGYWNRGVAELTRYELSQARYGELHPGHAVLVFVTEEFLKDKQVKLESNNRRDAVPILKLNAVRKFATGIYDYSMMSSVFTPSEFRKHPRTLKITTTSQEWCGHTFTQLNLRGNDYRLRQYSYFEAEGDQDLTLKSVPLEDEVWTKLRLSPDLLPEGKLLMFPGTFYLRLMHKPLEPQKVLASKSDYTGTDFKGENLKTYTLGYGDLQRTLQIVYEGAFPYRIAGWTEERMSGFGANARRLKSIARRTHELRSPYWSQHDLKDRALRAKLGLD